MPNWMWILSGAVVAGAGGAVANWALYGVDRRVEGDTLSIAVAGGAAYAAILGGLLSAGRGGKLSPMSQVLRRFISVLFGVGLFFTMILFGIWVPAILGGLVGLVILWVGLGVAGIQAVGPHGGGSTA